MAIDINIPSQVKNYANLAAFPATGTLKTIFIAEDTNKTYRWTGSAYVEISPAGASGITIGTTAITSGTVGSVLFEGTGNVVSESANITWNNTTKQLVLGATGTSGNIQFLRTSDGLEVGGIRGDNSGTQVGGSGYTSNIVFGNGGTMQFSATGEKMRLVNSTGNLLINTTTDAGFKLDVNGTARVSDNLTISKTIDGITSLSLLNSSTGTTASSRFYLGATTTQVGKLGSNYTTGSILKSGDLFMYNQTVGNITFWNNLSTGNINFTTGSATTAQMTIASTGNVLINTTTDEGFKLDVNGTARVSSTVGQTLIVQSSLDSSFTAIAEFNASALSTSRTGFVAIGRNGATNNQASLGFFYSGNGSNSNRLDFGFYGTTPRMSIFAGGNVGINTTTDAGFKLDVNGTARVTGALTVGGTQLFFNGAFYNTINDRNHFGGAVSISTFLRVGTNANTVASAILQADSTTKGFLPPRMTTTEKNAITSPASGLQVFDTTLNQMSYYNGTTWTNI